MKQLLHQLSHIHRTITKDGVDIEIFFCVQRIWWRPWYVNMEKIHVGVKRINSPWVIDADIDEASFFELTGMTQADDIILFIAQKAKEASNDRIQQKDPAS